MQLKTLEDWTRAGGDQMRCKLTTADPPARFAVCRHHASWLQMFRLFLLSHDATDQLEFLEAVDELRMWEPHAAMTRRIYDLYVTGTQDGGRRQLEMSGPIRAALTRAFGTVHPPDRADVFAVAYQEVVLVVNDSWYGEFKKMAAGLRTVWDTEVDQDARAEEDGLDRERMGRHCRKALPAPIRVAV
jgi:Regulator of G protein signaling domain